MMEGMCLPPGFRFHPTDAELVDYYLRRKVEGLKIELDVVPVIDLYKFDPWELPDKSFLPKRDMEWFFFCPRDRKYPNGSRTNRATGAGYWKATGKDRKVVCPSSVSAMRKTLVFYRGRAPAGDRTDWVMHEYRLFDELPSGSCSFRGAFALCRVMKKNEDGQKSSDLNGVQDRNPGASCSAMNVFASRMLPYDCLDVYQQRPNGADQCIKIYEATPATSPGDDRRETGLEQTGLLLPHDPVLDPTQAFPEAREASPESFTTLPLHYFVQAWPGYYNCTTTTNPLYSVENGSSTNIFSQQHFLSSYNGFLPHIETKGEVNTAFPTPEYPESSCTYQLSDTEARSLF